MINEALEKNNNEVIFKVDFIIFDGSLTVEENIYENFLL